MGGARGRVGTEVLCLKMHGDPLNNFDKLLAVRLEANHRIFLKLCYLEGTTLFSPTGERNSRVGLLVGEYSKCIHKKLLQQLPCATELGPITNQQVTFLLPFLRLHKIRA